MKELTQLDMMEINGGRDDRTAGKREKSRRKRRNPGNKDTDKNHGSRYHNYPGAGSDAHGW